MIKVTNSNAKTLGMINMQISIVIGTVTGTALSVGRFLQKQLNQKAQIHHHEYPCLDEVLLDKPDLVIFCISNTGVGELPPSMRKFYVQITEQNRKLDALNYLIINLADSSFKSFAKSGETLDEALQSLGAKNLSQRFIIDAMTDRYPRQSALKWIENELISQGLITSRQ